MVHKYYTVVDGSEARNEINLSKSEQLSGVKGPHKQVYQRFYSMGLMQRSVILQYSIVPFKCEWGFVNAFVCPLCVNVVQSCDCQQ